MEMLLRARELHKRYGEFVALGEVSFDVEKEEVIAVVGPNGAGKTTLVNALAGLHRPDSGDILFEGRSILGLSPAKLSLRGLARSFQLVSTFPTLTVGEMILVGAFARGRRTFTMLEPISRFGAERQEIERVAGELGLQESLSRKCSELSQGQKKLVDIASALALKPRLLLLDEPTSGISSAEKYGIMEKLLEAASRCGVESVVLVEHDMELIARYATRVIGLKAGEIVADLPPKQFFADSHIIETLVGKVPPHAQH
jgi:branched-chain amino acid transport system ATP-binding protein